MRRRNHIAKDLRTPKYAQRIVQGRPKDLPPEIEEEIYDALADDDDYLYEFGEEIGE